MSLLYKLIARIKKVTDMHTKFTWIPGNWLFCVNAWQCVYKTRPEFNVESYERWALRIFNRSSGIHFGKLYFPQAGGTVHVCDILLGVRLKNRTGSRWESGTGPPLYARRSPAMMPLWTFFMGRRWLDRLTRKSEYGPTGSQCSASI